MEELGKSSSSQKRRETIHNVAAVGEFALCGAESPSKSPKFKEPCITERNAESEDSKWEAPPPPPPAAPAPPLNLFDVADIHIADTCG